MAASLAHKQRLGSANGKVKYVAWTMAAFQWCSRYTIRNHISVETALRAWSRETKLLWRSWTPRVRVWIEDAEGNILRDSEREPPE